MRYRISYQLLRSLALWSLRFSSYTLFPFSFFFLSSSSIPIQFFFIRSPFISRRRTNQFSGFFDTKQARPVSWRGSTNGPLITLDMCIGNCLDVYRGTVDKAAYSIRHLVEVAASGCIFTFILTLGLKLARLFRSVKTISETFTPPLISTYRLTFYNATINGNLPTVDKAATLKK